jgi:hypothetical protein
MFSPLNLLFLMTFSSGAAPVESTYVVTGIHIHLGTGTKEDPRRKDYYLSCGAAQRVKVGQRLEVRRSIPHFHEPQQLSLLPFKVPVGTLEVFHVDLRSSIARLIGLTQSERAAVSGPRAIMVGDHIHFLLEP